MPNSITPKRLNLILLTGIILLGAFFRIYKLGEIPAGFFIDEASEGYSAYSILKTGKDEFGKSFPAIFRSLGDFKTPTYIYLTVPFISIMGLNPMAVRFPSFLFSVLTIPVLYFLIRELVPQKHLSFGIWYLSSIASLLLAVSPWDILFARTATESVVASFLFLSGILTFFKGLKKPFFLVISGIIFALALPSYHAQRILVPLMFLILFIRYRKTLLDRVYRNYLIIGFVLALIISIPTFSVALTPGFVARALRVNAAENFVSNYISYLSPKYMFFAGDPDPGNSFPGLPTFFAWQLPFYLLGIWALVKARGIGKFKFFVFTTLLTSPIPAALARDTYSSVRSLPLLIPQITLIAFGIYSFFSYFKTKNGVVFWGLGLALLLALSTVKLYGSVFVLNEYHHARYWDYGWKELTSQLVKREPVLPVVMDTGRRFDYFELLFFMKYDPARFQKENFEVSESGYYRDLTTLPEKHIGNIDVRKTDWEKDLKLDQYLVGTNDTLSLREIKTYKLTPISEIYYPDGGLAFRIVRTHGE